MAAIVLLAYGWYFAVIYQEVSSEAIADIEYQGLVLVAVIFQVVLGVAVHIVIALTAPKEADRTDERDREISRHGEYLGGYVLTVGALVALALAMFEAEQFWIANVILAGLVLAQLTSLATRIVIYRRGF